MPDISRTLLSIIYYRSSTYFPIIYSKDFEKKSWIVGLKSKIQSTIMIFTLNNSNRLILEQSKNKTPGFLLCSVFTLVLGINNLLGDPAATGDEANETGKENGIVLHPKL